MEENVLTQSNLFFLKEKVKSAVVAANRGVSLKLKKENREWD